MAGFVTSLFRPGFRAGLLRLRDGLLRFRAGLLRFRAGLLSFRAGLLRFRMGLLGFHSDMPRLLPKYLWVLPEYSRLLHNNLASSAPRVSLPRVPGVPCGGSAIPISAAAPCIAFRKEASFTADAARCQSCCSDVSRATSRCAVAKPERIARSAARTSPVARRRRGRRRQRSHLRDTPRRTTTLHRLHRAKPHRTGRGDITRARGARGDVTRALRRCWRLRRFQLAGAHVRARPHRAVHST